MFSKEDKQDRAFSIVEIFVVVAIISIVAAVAIPAIVDARRAAVKDGVVHENAYGQGVAYVWDIEDWVDENPDKKIVDIVNSNNGTIVLYTYE